ncbi:hypothetical protein [Roseateles sp. BYS96W]|uniref:Uncharacterized protein n=1 Tax=Pelomonas nitida TaxID=3299027 RepID=A0ABW7G4C2_9BURK
MSDLKFLDFIVFQRAHLMKFIASFFCSAFFCAHSFAQALQEPQAIEVPATAETTASAPMPDAPKPTEPFRYSGVLTMTGDTQTADGQMLPDAVLRIVSPAERKKDVALMVVGALLGGFRTAVPKEDYKGDKVGAMPHPAGADLTQKLEPLVDGWTQLHAPKQTFKNVLWVRKDRFQLVYGEGSDEDLGYDLKIEATLSRKPDSAGFFSQARTVKCAYQDAGTKTTLAQWQADDYAKVRAAEAAFVESCAKSFQDNLEVLLSQ